MQTKSKVKKLNKSNEIIKKLNTSKVLNTSNTTATKKLNNSMNGTSCKKSTTTASFVFGAEA